MAKGILMDRYKVTPLQAFALLTAASERAGVKLSAIAESLTATGEFMTVDVSQLPRIRSSAGP
jgi:AmiR/NasT family two-component response regulator